MRTKWMTGLVLCFALLSSSALWADEAAIFTVKGGVSVENGMKTLSVSFEPHKGYYTEKDKPLKVTLTAPEGVTLKKSKLGWADLVAGTNKTPTLTTTYTGEGKDKKVDVKYRIGICEKEGKKLCHLKFGNLSLPLK